jgi:hypothetical protein
MEIEGTVQNGVVVLESESSLPEGTRVKVTAPESEPATPTHYDLFRDIIGQAEGLPEDFAKNHNHYIRGGPKQ